MNQIKDIHNGRYFFFYKSKLSNFNISPFNIYGRQFQCGQQALHWKKSMFFDDVETAELIYNNGLNPRQCLRLGRTVKNYNDQAWSSVRQSIMYQISLARFLQVQSVRNQLLQTGDKILVQASPIDFKYGIGIDIQTAKKTPDSEWKGDNMLGRVLTDVKNEIRKRLYETENRH